MKRIVGIDPGHGRKPGSPKYDPGVVDPRTGRAEAEAALAQALTLKARAYARGLAVHLTHDGTQDGKGNLAERMTRARFAAADAMVSVHYNMVGSYPMVYASPNEASRRLARLVARELGIPAEKVWDSTRSRFGRLYIDDFDPRGARPAVLVECAAIEDAPPAGEAGKAERTRVADAVLDALEAFYR